jgi:uncharacterized damage-inducible protein DinB
MTQYKISKPASSEYAPHFETYISEVKTENLIEELENGRREVLTLLQTIPSDKLEYRYQEGKWSIKEIIIHLMDAERIFTYRALRFSRNDRTAVAGFDENEYIPESNASERSLQSLIDEYSALRQSTIEFFKNITAEMSLRTGISNGKEISVRALAYSIPGHEIHHLGVIRERYL